MASPVDGSVGTGDDFVMLWSGAKGSGVGGDEADSFTSGGDDDRLVSGRWGCAATTAASRSRFANELLASCGGGFSGIALAGVRSLEGPACLSSSRMTLISSTAERSSDSEKREIGKNCCGEWLSRGTHATRRLSGSRRSFGALAGVVLGGIELSFA